MIDFYKYHGLGNDFIFIDNLNGEVHLEKPLIEKLCHRRFGIGADGIVFVEKSDIADAKMVIYNSDGSLAEMCGNATRCFAKHLYDKGIAKKPTINIETAAGIMKVAVKVEDGFVKAAEVNMGAPALEDVNQLLRIDNTDFYITHLLMGVPHTVVFTDSLEDDAVIMYGKKIENSPRFPKKTNVNFVKVISPGEVIVRTWERGAGYTMACGTGACASVVAGVSNHLLAERVTVHLRGGDLSIEWRDRKEVWMEGPAEEVFRGSF